MEPKQEARIRKMVRNQIIGAIQADLNGGELLMKEVNEELSEREEYAIADDELKRVVVILQKMD